MDTCKVQLRSKRMIASKVISWSQVSAPLTISEDCLISGPIPGDSCPRRRTSRRDYLDREAKCPFRKGIVDDEKSSEP